MKRIIHDSAWAATASIMDCLQPVLCPEEVKDVAGMVYEAIKAAIEAAFVTRTHEEFRLAPCKN